MASYEHKGHRQRLRHRAKTEGLDNFIDYQVLEYALSFVIPYKDVNPLAHKLIDKFGSFGAVLEANEEDLCEVEGMGEVSAHFLTSIIKLYAYYEREKSKQVASINNPKEAIDYVAGLLKGKLHEELVLVCLTPNNKVMCVETVAKGTGAEAKVSVRKLTDLISRHKAHNIIVAHNHPSGTPKPSDEDNKLTKALVTSMAINEVHVIDHIIVAGDDFYSYRLDGYIDKFKEDIAYVVYKKIAQLEMPYEVNYDKK